MRLTVLGSAGTYPVSGRPGSGYLIEQDGTRVWCDAGPGTLVALPVDVTSLDAIFVSHRHPDHCLDVIIAAHLFAYGPAPRFGVPLYGPESALESLIGFVDGGGRICDVYDLRPLVDVDWLNGDLRLDEERALRLSPAFMPPATRAPLMTCVGGDESSEFLRQNALLGSRWSKVFAGDIAMPGRHHFSVIDALAEPGSALFAGARRLMKLDP